MKIYKEYYVSVKPDSELAYVLPLSGSEKKIAEQKSKGESWAKSRTRKEDSVTGQITWEYEDGESFALPNEPTSGYEIIGFSDRYSTSNKHIYLKHPKGFHFEMAIETFIEMIKETTVEQGVIKEDLVIYSYKGKNALCVYGGSLYDTLEEEGTKYLTLDKLKDGDVITLKGKSKIDNKITYIGKRKLSADIEICYNTEQLVDVSKSTDWYFHSSKRYEKDEAYQTSVPQKESHLFLLTDKYGDKLFTYTNTKSIKVVNILSSEEVTDSKVLEVIGDRSYLLSTLTGSNYYKEQREVLLTKLSETCKLGDKVWNSYSYLDVELKQVYVEKG